MRRYRALVLLLVLVGCDRQLHRLFEAPPPPYIRLSITMDASTITLARGQERTLTVTVTRTGEDRGPVSLTFEGAPAGLTASTKSSSAAGDVTTATVSIRAATDATVGNYSVTVRARANQATDATSLLVLTIIEPPDFALGTTKPALTIARGGIARVGLRLSRTNLSSPVTLSATSDSGLTAQLAANPLAGDTTTATIAVDPSVAVGKHTIVLRASVAGLGERTATLEVDVTADPLQVLVQGDLSTPQLSAVSEEVIVNGLASAGPVALSVDGLPPDANATFDPIGANNAATRLHFQIAGTSPAGSYALTVRASASGVSDATAHFTLRVVPAGIALAVAPATATVFTGSGAAVSLSITRSNFGGAVAFSTDPLPAGLNVSFDSLAITGGVATASMSVASAVAPGTYTLGLHATPIGLAPVAAQSASVALTVLAGTGSGSNVALDWSKCPAPDWVAIQDGSGPWTRLTASQGIFTSGVSSSVVGIAYVERRTSVTVRYMTQDELTAQPLDMCGRVAGTRTLTGSGIHSTNELGAYLLGGGSGTSSAAKPNFAIAGVRDGTHDLIAYSYFQTGAPAPSRIVIRRDITVGAATDTIAPVDFQGNESFAPIPMTPGVTVSGPFLAGETYSHSMGYFTTPTCNGGLLYTSPAARLSTNGQFSFSLASIGIPDVVRRPDDYYQLSVVLTGNGSFRTSSIAFHAQGLHPLQLAPLVPATTISTISGPYKRLQVVFGAVPPAYDGNLALKYDDGSRSMTVIASRAYIDRTTTSFVMPDLSTANGWPSAAAVPGDATGAWRFTLDGGSSGDNVCAENRVAYSSGRTGIF